MAIRSPNWRLWRPICIAVACCALVGAWGGCNAQKRYQVLSFFFDGVPDPNAPPEGRRGSLDGRPRARIYMHKPYADGIANPNADGTCNGCHTGNPQMSVFETMNTLSIESKVCLKCHDRVLREYPVMHGPVVSVECLRCHAPHESSHPALLAKTSPAVCVQCHDRELLPPPPEEHLNPKADCLECHSGHGALRHGLLKVRPATLPTTLPTLPTSEPVQASSPAATSAVAGIPRVQR